MLPLVLNHKLLTFLKNACLNQDQGNISNLQMVIENRGDTNGSLKKKIISIPLSLYEMTFGIEV